MVWLLVPHSITVPSLDPLGLVSGPSVVARRGPATADQELLHRFLSSFIELVWTQHKGCCESM